MLLIVEINKVQHGKWAETKDSSLQKSPTDSCLAQLADYQTDDPNVIGSNATGW